MQFSVAAESTSASTLDVVAMEWTKNRSVIDCRAEIYTFTLLPCLISADLIRQFENPHLSPSLSPMRLVLGVSCSSTVVSPKLHCLAVQGPVGCRLTHCSHCSR